MYMRLLTTTALSCLLLGLVRVQGSRLSDIDPTLIETDIKNILEASLKHKEIQDHLDTLSYNRRSLQGNALLNMLSSSFSAKFQSRVSAVKNLRDAVMTSYSESYSGAGECCSVAGHTLEYDSRFKQAVSFSKVCELVSSSAAYDAARLENAFKDACVENLRNVPSLKWQYFGSEQGVTTTFPATKANDCGSYDNRFRSWYVQTNVPKPKQVVVVLDKSGSMRQTYNGMTYIGLAKIAVKTVLDTLNPFDMFGVVSFSSDASTFSPNIPNGGCFSEELAQATPQNKRLVKAYVDAIQPGGNTMYSRALDRAFKYYNTSWRRALEERVLLFMSDGAPSPTDTTIMETLQRRNNAINNSVVVMTYGLGSGIDFSVLRNMATSTTAEVESLVKVGTFTHISNPSQLRNEMAAYYNFFAARSEIIEEPIWTVPYLDSWGLGLMVTASLPVHVGGHIAGVAAVDITIEELLAESSYFKPTEMSYSFVINHKGLVINHPLFPYVTDHEPLFVEATAFERDEEFLSVFNSMKRGESGTKAFQSTRILPQGDSKKYGIRTVRVPSTYFWKQIPGTKFSLCLVLADEDSQSVLQPLSPLPSGSFLYHRLDLVPPPDKCHHANSYSAQSKSAVALAARSFEDAELYMSGKMTADDVKNIGRYMEGQTTSNPNLKDGVRDSVTATYKADELWRSTENDNLTRHVFWRYVATNDGMFRIYPGTQMPHKYDPVVRGWFLQAQANRDKYVITPPYRDAASRVSIITLSKALFEGRADGFHDPVRDKLIGAAGVDIITPYFYERLLQIYPLCAETAKFKCLLIDQAGYVIVSEVHDDSSMPSEQHIAEFEPAIAEVLIQDRVLLPRTCSYVDRALTQRTYTIAENQGRYTGVTAYPNCHTFQLIPVGGSNAHLVVLDKEWSACGDSHQEMCYCNHIAANSFTPTCDRHADRICECPCTSYTTEFHPCTNSYNFTRNAPHPCTPEAVDHIATPNPRSDITSLSPCYDISFTPPEDHELEEGDDTVSLHPGVIAAIVCIGVMFGLRLYTLHRSDRRTRRNNNQPPPLPPSTVNPGPPPVQPPSNPNYGYIPPGQLPTAPPHPPPTNMGNYGYGASPSAPPPPAPPNVGYGYQATNSTYPSSPPMPAPPSYGAAQKF